MESVDWTIIGPAMLAGIIVLSTHVPLGQEVLKRGIIFIDLAIAQVAGLGVIAAHAMDWDPNGLEVQIAAISAAVAAAVGLSWTEKRWSNIQEPLIGILFILAATGGILLLAGNPHGSEHLKELLVGQILWQTWSSLIPIAILYAVVLVAWFAMRSRFRGLPFYLVFAVVVTASVQIVGIYLVFASLIIPSLATTGIRHGNRLMAGYLIGTASYLIGILVSFRLDLPTGAVIVWSMAVSAALVGTVISDKQRQTNPDRAIRGD
ncbi:MAG: metal ABC transporter permease [Woeseiaceae bacterium]|nr:metal ABC transporter permease [Woeseiaceae bacterium]